MKSLRYFTWARSKRDFSARLLFDSCKINGLEPTVMSCSHISQKPESLSRATIDLKPYEIVLCTDGYDVLCLGSIESIVKKFELSGANILFGSEKLFYHHLPSSLEYFESVAHDLDYPCLNSGMFIGYAGAINEMMDTINSWDHEALNQEFDNSNNTKGFYNDQTMFGHYATLNQDKVALDGNASLFWNVSGETEHLFDNFLIENGIVTNPLTNTNPCFIHVTELKRKYYPIYLSIAQRMGVTLSNRNVDVLLMDQFIKRMDDPDHVDFCAIEQGIIEKVQSLTFYRLMKLYERAQKVFKNARIRAGKIRRKIFSGRSNLQP